MFLWRNMANNPIIILEWRSMAILKATKWLMVVCTQISVHTGLQIRRDNLWIIFLIFRLKHIL